MLTFVYFNHDIDKMIHFETGFGGNENNWRPSKVWKITMQIKREFFIASGVFVRIQIPFIDDKDDGFPVFQNFSRNIFVLHGNVGGRIDEK